jgi:4-nitrophenyl phosphatase
LVLKNIAVIVLAAGGSSRFGQPKQLLDWAGTPLVAHAADVALDADVGPVIVVLGYRAQAVQAALGGRDIQAAMNWRWEDGLSTSVQVGLAALPPETGAAILMPCDQPLLTASLLQALADRFAETDAAVIHPTCAGRRGPPTLFSRRLFPELAAVTGDVGGRGIIARHADAVATIEIDDIEALADIDTPADYERLLEERDRRLEIEERAQSVPPPVAGEVRWRERAAQPTSEAKRDPLRNIRHLIIDMDGVLWRGDEPVPDLQAFFEFLRQRDVGFILATNNSSRTPEQYVEKLARFGVAVDGGSILTSALVAAAYLADRAPKGTRVYAIGKQGLRQALEERGFVLSEEAAYVVVGWNTDLVWDELATASLLIHRGAGFIGTNPDVSYPTERGPVPGNGAQLAAIQVTTGVSPVVTGKPEPQMYEEAIRRMSASLETTAVIGDRLDTDLAGGVRLGLTTVLVLSGIASADDVSSSSITPDVVCADIGELMQIWEPNAG